MENHALGLQSRCGVLPPAEPDLISQDRDEIQVEARLLYVPVDTNDVEDFLKEERVKLSQMKQDPNQWSCLLNDDQVKRLLALARENPGWKCLVAPRVTVFDGEAATVRITTEIPFVSGYTDANAPSEEPQPKHDSIDTGLSLQIRPELLPDGTNTIITDFALDISDIAGYTKFMYKGKYPYEVPTVQRIAISTHYSAQSGQTLLRGGSRTTEPQDDRVGQKDLLILIKTERLPERAGQRP